MNVGPDTGFGSEIDCDPYFCGVWSSVEIGDYDLARFEAAVEVGDNYGTEGVGSSAGPGDQLSENALDPKSFSSEEPGIGPSDNELVDQPLGSVSKVGVLMSGGHVYVREEGDARRLDAL